MTTKLANFKTFLQKAKKPCSKPGEHRHLGYDYCHPITSVHHKHNNLGLNAHHGMDEFGQIPTGTIPPNWEDDHHLAKPHGEKTGSTGGNCNPVEYPKGSGKIVPAHRHTGADYCHPITQKHGASAPDGAAWHNTHQAEIDESWQLFNDQQGLEYTADYSAETGFPAEGADPLQTDYVPYLEDDAPTFKDILPNLQVGSTINYYGSNLEVLKVSDYSVVASAEQGVLYDFGPSDFQQNDPNISVVDAEPEVPTGDVINEINPHELQVGTTISGGDGYDQWEMQVTAITSSTVSYMNTEGVANPSKVYTDDLSNFNAWVTGELTTAIPPAHIQHPGLNDIPNPQSPPIPTGTIDDPYTEEYLNTLPKIGESVSDVNTLASFPPGTQFMAENGLVITLLEVKQGLNAAGNEAVTNYHLDMGNLGDQWFNGYQWPSGFGKFGYEPTVSQLSPDISSAMDKGFQLGQSIIPSTLNMLPVGLAFAVAGKTFTITENNSAAFQNVKPGTGIKVSAVDENGTTFPEIPLDQNIIDAITGTAEGKIVGLPSGIASQQATAKAPAFNKNGLAEKTKITYINPVTGEKFTGTISYAHKTPKKGGFNYTIDYDDKDGGFVSSTKTHSSLLEDPESEKDYGYFVTDAVHKEGMEPDDDPLELPPLGSEPGNFDDVLENVGGKLGYNEGGTFKHKQTGQQFYIKFSSSGNDEQVKSEDLANKLYGLLGISTLGTSLITFDKKTALKSTWNPNLETIPIGQMSKEVGILDSFVADAWLANWDVIGPNHDNTQKFGDKIVKIDSGGALTFGGSGKSKPFTATVNEIENMQDPSISKYAGKVYQNIPTEHLVTGAQKLAKVTDAHIDAIVDNSQISNKENMKEVLKARRDAIVGKLLNESQTAASAEMLHPNQHKHEGHPGWHNKDLAHSSAVANAAHQKLGLPFTEPKKYIGSTLAPGQDFFSTVANSTTIPAQYKTLINEALAINFNKTKSVEGRIQRIQDFLKKNNITDKFSGNFSNWQGGGYYIGNIRVAAALFELKGEAAAAKDSQEVHWGWTMEQANVFEDSWNSGTADALSLIPYVVASQQYVTDNYPGEFTVHRGLADRTNNKVGSQVKDSLKKVKPEDKKDFTVQFPGGTSAVAAGWSDNLTTSKKFAPKSGNGVIFKKSIKAEDVLLHFRAWSDSYTGEEEVIIDPNSANRFSYDEILLSGVDY